MRVIFKILFFAKIAQAQGVACTKSPRAERLSPLIQVVRTVLSLSPSGNINIICNKLSE
jgi:hypothetical protein